MCFRQKKKVKGAKTCSGVHGGGEKRRSPMWVVLPGFRKEKTGNHAWEGRKVIE